SAGGRPNSYQANPGMPGDDTGPRGSTVTNRPSGSRYGSRPPRSRSSAPNPWTRSRRRSAALPRTTFVINDTGSSGVRRSSATPLRARVTRSPATGPLCPPGRMQLPVPRLDDGVVSLRPPAAGDIDAITDACQDPEIPRWTRVPTPYTRAHAGEYVERSARTWDQGTVRPFAIVAAPAHPLLA